MATRKRAQAKFQTLKAECESCSGSGVYQGFAEPKGTGVICYVCGGTGCVKIRYKVFQGRRERTGIERVQRSRGAFLLTGAGPKGKAISYTRFLQGHMP